MTSCNNHFVYTSTSQYPNPNQLYITRIFCKKVQNLAQFCYQNSKLSALIAGNGIWGVLVFKISRVGYPRTSLHSSYRLYFHARNIASRKYLIGRSYKNYGFDWPFLFADCIIAWHESITLALVCSCVHPPPPPTLNSFLRLCSNMAENSPIWVKISHELGEIWKNGKSLYCCIYCNSSFKWIKLNF